MLVKRLKGKKWTILLISIVLITLIHLYLAKEIITTMYVIAFLLIFLMLIKYERNQASARRLVLLSIFVSVAVVSRVLFFFLPGFSPMVSLIILSGVFLGKEVGLMTGLLCPLVSNLLYGQGPWTPFQMVILAMIGGLAGTTFLAKYLMKNRLVLSLYAIFAGLVFSMVMDIWTVYSMDGYFSLKRYLSVLFPSVVFMMSYISSNLLFLNVLIKPMAERLKRVKDKYEL